MIDDLRVKDLTNYGAPMPNLLAAGLRPKATFVALGGEEGDE